jgi:hypothetical protein
LAVIAPSAKGEVDYRGRIDDQFGVGFQRPSRRGAIWQSPCRKFSTASWSALPAFKHPAV